MRKGIDRLEKQILWFINVFIPRDQTNIALLKKCKIVDVPALNSLIENVQKALQKYVGFSGMDPEYCDGIAVLMDRAQAWCLDIEELYNKAEVHSIYTWRGFNHDWLNLRPGEDGKYHEITAMGMESVTAGFGEYKLKDIA